VTPFRHRRWPTWMRRLWETFSCSSAMDFLSHPNPETALSTTAAVAGSSQGRIRWRDLRFQRLYNPEHKAQKAANFWSMYPTSRCTTAPKPTQRGQFRGHDRHPGHRFLRRRVRAPHHNVGFGVPLRGAYDYLLNTRNNHMPLPTWCTRRGLPKCGTKATSSRQSTCKPDPKRSTCKR
jgi:hypothetical protein